MPLEGAAGDLQSGVMQVPLRPGTDLVCNCRAGHRGTVSADGTAPPLPAACTGSFWSRPLAPSGWGRIYGARVSAGVIAPSSTDCAYRT